MNTAAQSGNHALFQGHLKDSRDSVWLVARWLQERGNAVVVNPLSVAERHEDWKKHTDSGDLAITQRVEVKSLSAEFVSRETWPFGEKFIVCAKHAWDLAVPRPYSFIYVNRAKTHVALVMGTTHKRWFVEDRVDSRYDGVKQAFYFCPLDDVRFLALRGQEPGSPGAGVAA